MAAEVGIWRGHYADMTLPWMRWWDMQGNLLAIGDERTEQERQAKELALQEITFLKAKLRELGLDLPS